MYFWLTWRDPRAAAEIAKATAALQNGTTCHRLCTTRGVGTLGAQCCDTIWLPSLNLRNALDLSGGRLQPYTISTRPGGAVFWRMQVTGTFHASLDFRRFPFDSQQLTLHLQALQPSDEPQVTFVKSGLGAFCVFCCAFAW